MPRTLSHLYAVSFLAVSCTFGGPEKPKYTVITGPDCSSTFGLTRDTTDPALQVDKQLRITQDEKGITIAPEGTQVLTFSTATIQDDDGNTYSRSTSATKYLTLDDPKVSPHPEDHGICMALIDSVTGRIGAPKNFNSSYDLMEFTGGSPER